MQLNCYVQGRGSGVGGKKEKQAFWGDSADLDQTQQQQTSKLSCM